ncbi:MAG TPA: alpha/beta hydrolase [Actinomycetota bacterium]
MGYLRVRGAEGTLFPKDRCVVSFDGTHLAYTIAGNGERVIALCAGYCCPDNFWKYIGPSLSRHYRVLIWNYRGCGVSGMPREPGYRARNYTIDDFRLDRYARDLKAILDHEGIDQAVLLGHSMGVQVCLEAYRLMPKRVSALVSITGPYASAIHTIFNTTVAPRVFPLASFALGKLPAAVAPAWRALFRSSIPHPLAVQFGILGPDTAAEDMRPYYDHMAMMDPQIMLKMAQAMHEHSAEDLLRHVKVPALVVVGERDNFVPPWLGHVMASRMPLAELLTVEGGTHGTILERQQQVNRAVADFLRRHLHDGKGTVSLAGKRRSKAAAVRKAAKPNRG